jgi:hypothetical protein
MSTHAERYSVTLVTDGDGAATGYTDVLTGPIRTIRYAKVDFANGVDFAITLEATGESVWAEDNVDASATRAPRQATHSVAGVASLYAGSGTAVNDMIVAVRDRVKVVIASGGAAKSGTFHVVVG